MRIVLGIVLILVGLLVPMASAALQIFLVVLGIIMLVTAFLNFCPLYIPFKINTRK